MMAHKQQQIHTTNTNTMGSTLATEAKIPNVPKPKNELIDILARQRPGSYLKYTACLSFSGPILDNQ